MLYAIAMGGAVRQCLLTWRYTRFGVSTEDRVFRRSQLRLSIFYVADPLVSG